MTDRWAVRVEAAGRGRPIDGEQLRALSVRLAEHDGVVHMPSARAAREVRYGATIVVHDAVNPVHALADAVWIFTQASARADLPAVPIVRAEVVSGTEATAAVR